MKKEKGKALELYNTSSDFPCKKHPFSNSVGICAQCLRERLLKLVCSEDDVILLKRSSSSSSCVEMKRRNGIWGIGKLFRKKREMGNLDQRIICNGFEEKSDLWVVSRSRSLCSFRNGGFFGEGDGNFSGARSSIEPRKSGFGFKDGNFTAMDDDPGFIDLNFDKGVFNNGGSCRITGSDRGVKRSRRSFKSWRWIFRPNSNARKKDDDDDDDVSNLVG